MIDVEVNGKKTQEMHADGGLSGQVFVAPESILNTSSTVKLPASELYLIANNRLTSEFQTTERSLIFVLGHSIAVGVQSMLRMNIDRAYAMAKRNSIPFNLSYPALAADQQGKGAFDPEFMRGLFELGVARGKSGQPFVQEVGEALRSSLHGHKVARAGRNHPKLAVNYIRRRTPEALRDPSEFNHYSTRSAH